MKYFREILLQNKFWVAAYLCCGIVCSFLGAYSTIYLQRLLDNFGAGTLSESTIWIYCAMLATQFILQYLDNTPDIKLENRIYLGFKLMALEKMRVISFRAYQHFGAGGLIQRIENGASAGKGILYSFFFRMIYELVPGLIFSLFFIERIDSSIMLYIAAGYVVVFITSNLLLKYLYRIKSRILDNEELLNNYLVRGLMELVVFRTNRRYRTEYARASQAANNVVNSKVAMRMIHEAFFTLFALLVLGIKMLILLASINSGVLTVGAIVALLTLIDQAYVPIAIGNVLYVQYKLDLSAFGRLRAFLDLPDDPRLSQGGEAPANPNGDILLQNVRVDYEGRTALNGLTLDIAPCRSTALVGESGSGKSTVAKLISGLILPNEGHISINGQNMERLSLDDYYQHLCYTSQEAPVFSGTLRENLAFDEPIPDIVLINALRDAELGSFYDTLPEGLNTQVGERGMLMSGGERQRLALARVFLSGAEIVVLDESTSALDSALEKSVMDRLMHRLSGRTIVIIAHRLNSIAGADEIVAMRDGKLVERGGFDALIQQDGYFAQLWQAAQRNVDS